MEEEQMKIPEVTLSSGHKMPLIGMGTTAHPLPPNDTLVSVFLDAIDTGYRHFDTASMYGSEEALGLAVKLAVERGLIKNRQEMFITSKLWCSDAHPDLVLPALQCTLKTLGMDYLDLYLIHFPLRLKQGSGDLGSVPKENILPFDINGTWEAMEECSRLGLAKSIGVSNFGHKKLTQLLQHATIPPAVNQVEMNVSWQQQKLLQFCKERGIHVTAWSPLSANGARWGTLQVMESPILKEIAAAEHKTVAQVALRWIYQQGASFVVKTFNKERMRENLQIFNSELSTDELEKIKQIPQRRGWSGDVIVHKDGPYKTLEELWDGDT
ncbi:methylecgonone reductase-like [Tripterygium wilfordii]|uniref:Methylecgonone reductase-like n=1 Tax=Tripterygium wilfordii TaxID=458696 RepID=A0A7J7CJ28_TRIWF|nr:protein REDOX 2-like [Tripterygium wilfordii]KAF5734062.1 methylecgonone reductase-like [Tripterygium wilfordii]